MKDDKQLRPLSWIAIITVLITSCSSFDVSLSRGDEKPLTASGVIEAKEISVAAEVGGKVKTVQVSNGEKVFEGDELFTLNQEAIIAQRKQANAQLNTAQSNLKAGKATLVVAEASVEAAKVGVEAAELGYEQALQQARFEQAPSRVEDWNQNPPREFDLPAWYFPKDEQRTAAEAGLKAAEMAYQTEKERYQDLLQESGNDELAAAEERLAEAQASFSVAQSLLDHEVGFDGREEIDDYRQTIYDAAEAELNAAQEKYHQLLSETESSDILEGRARLSVARERYQLALDRVQSFHTGEDAIQVQQAQNAVKQAKANRDQAQARLKQAKAGVEQAEKAVRQAESSLELINLKIEKHTVEAPVDGVILTRNVDPGEVIQPGLTAMTIGLLDDLTVMVYIPEDQYGKIALGDQAQLRVDSFPDQAFDAKVIRIADEAEYTPRNVQTKEERQKTVFAVELSVISGIGKLKPGMPTDVTFQTSD